MVSVVFHFGIRDLFVGGGRKGFLETAVIKIGRMRTILSEVLVQVNNKREGKKHLAQRLCVPEHSTNRS